MLEGFGKVALPSGGAGFGFMQGGGQQNYAVGKLALGPLEPHPQGLEGFVDFPIQPFGPQCLGFLIGRGKTQGHFKKCTGFRCLNGIVLKCTSVGVYPSEVLDMGKTAEVTDANFEQTLKDNQYVLVDFWAEWCGPCRMVAPVIEDLAGEYEGKIKVTKLDVDANPQTAMKYRVMSIPTVILFKDGQPAEVMVGAAPKQRFVNQISKHVAQVSA